jgi:hypothetical protein
MYDDGDNNQFSLPATSVSTISNDGNITRAARCADTFRGKVLLALPCVLLAARSSLELSKIPRQLL